MDDKGAEIWAHPGTLPGLAGEVATVGLLTGYDKEYLVRGPSERGKEIGVILQHENKGCHGESVPRGFRQR